MVKFVNFWVPMKKKLDSLQSRSCRNLPSAASPRYAVHLRALSSRYDQITQGVCYKVFCVCVCFFFSFERTSHIILTAAKLDIPANFTIHPPAQQTGEQKCVNCKTFY